MFTIYSQNDPKWKDEELGIVDGDSIGEYGCYLTSFAMMATYYGKDVNPSSLNQMFKSPVMLYVSGDLMTDDQLTKVFPDIKYQQTYDYSGGAADLNLIKSFVDQPPTAVILGIDSDHDAYDGLSDHFVLADSFDQNGDLWIDDPWTGTRVKFKDAYGDPATLIMKAVVYSGPVQSQDPIQVLADQIKTNINGSMDDEAFKSYIAGISPSELRNALGKLAGVR